MPTGALPHYVDLRGLAARGVHVAGTVELRDMQRLSEAVVGADEPARVQAVCARDDMGRSVCELQVTMKVQVECQRCIAPMDIVLDGASRIAALWTDSQAEDLPENLEPLIVGDEADLWLLAEEELLLALPPFPLHEDTGCGARTDRAQPAPEADTEEPVDRENPFAALASLREALAKDSTPD